MSIRIVVRRTSLLLLTVALAAGPFSSSRLFAQSGQAPTSAMSGSGQSPADANTLSLTMQQAVDMALEFNLGIKATKMSTAIAAQDLAGARSAYVPQVSAGFSRGTSESIPTNFLESSALVVNTSTFGVSSTVRQAVPFFGSSYSATWSGGRVATDSLSSYNPALSSTITLNFAQPLLRNFRIDTTRANVKVQEINQSIVNSQVQQQIESTARTTRLAYLQLISAIQGLAVAQQNLDVSNASLRNNKARVDVGVSAPADLVSAEAQVASYEEGVIVAKSSIESAMDQLRQLILDPTRADYWTIRLQPADTVAVQPPSIDVEAAVQNALKNRMDLEQARQSLKANAVNVDLTHNQKLPSVDFNVTYSASGKAGTYLQYDTTQLPPVLLNSASRSFSSALGDSFSNGYPSWTYGVTVGYPIGNTAARVASTRAELSKRQAEVNLAALQQEIATEVRAAARQVDTNYKRILTTRAALDAQEKQLEAEQKRFDVGLSDNFKLFQFQRDVAAARVQALNAELSYSQALIQFEAVQRIR